MHFPKGHSSTDQYLVDQVLKGDQQAFAQIVRLTEGLVAQIVFKMIPAPGDRQDIVQDVYLKAFRNPGCTACFNHTQSRVPLVVAVHKYYSSGLFSHSFICNEQLLYKLVQEYSSVCPLFNCNYRPYHCYISV